MQRELSNSVPAVLYAYFRVWRDQRAQRRQSLRQYRLPQSAELSDAVEISRRPEAIPPLLHYPCARVTNADGKGYQYQNGTEPTRIQQELDDAVPLCVRKGLNVS